MNVTGLLPVLKQPGLTSHDVVARARRLLGTRRIGHTGTLDPGVGGVLVLLVGRATRLAELLQAEDKAYIAEMCLGASTDTQDAFGRLVGDTAHCAIAADELVHVMARFVGPLQQVPPMTAAVRQGGRRLYEFARQGIEVERPPRQVFIDELDIMRTVPDGTTLGKGTRVTFHVVCSKGTYVRTLCHDIGRALGCGAFMSFLLRTQVGAIDLRMTRTLDELEAEASTGPVRLLPADTALSHIPWRRVTESGAGHVIHGRGVGREHFMAKDAPDRATAVVGARSNEERTLSDRPRPGAELLRLYDGNGRFLALAKKDAERPDRWRPHIVFCNERGDSSG